VLDLALLKADGLGNAARASNEICVAVLLMRRRSGAL
jgi:hypothetical protein